MSRTLAALLLASASIFITAPANVVFAETPAIAQQASATVHYRSVKIDGVNVFYREAGPADGPVVVLLHGFPTSSHMFRNLIPLLADRYRVIAPDYPGFGQSDAPDHTKFEYSFGHYADIVDTLLTKLGATKYSMYLMDYGAPVGYRLALKHPDRVTGMIVQNGNAYDEGIRDFWNPIPRTRPKRQERLRLRVLRDQPGAGRARQLAGGRGRHGRPDRDRARRHQQLVAGA